ncbi:contact-dependent growth inhibition system immunity protein [Saccharopolyspora sp. SCSIO 74807]|uniref:contact-dependent growth inhibition system immunity protein n=1 Tax=Saccharopolyspora sp. SCSIO 74807 TaxID=3118084 RepID=UPI00387E2C8E
MIRRFSAEELGQVFGAYLNQYFIDEYDGPWDAVQDFCAGHPPESVAHADEQVRTLLERDSAEHRPEAATEVGAGVPPSRGRLELPWVADRAKCLPARTGFHTACMSRTRAPCRVSQLRSLDLGNLRISTPGISRSGSG